MGTRRICAIRYVAALVMLFLLSSFMGAQEQQQRGSDKYLCSDPRPETICTAENTCGAGSTMCTVEVKRTASGHSRHSKAKANEPFSTKVGSTGYLEKPVQEYQFCLGFGPESPFGSDAIIGGPDRPVSAVTKKKGCYKKSAGACVSGSTYGMCASVETELIITGSE